MPAAFCIDASQPDGSHPALLSFLVGRHARTWGQAPASARKHAVLEQLARLHGPEALRPIDWLERDWAAEPYSRGCPTAYMTPGTMVAYGAALRQPVGRIHWAVTETATEWTGFMEGALQELRLYHHPDCFTIQTPTSVLSNWLTIEQQLSQPIDARHEVQLQSFL